MVVWELSSKGGRHPWMQGCAWEASGAPSEACRMRKVRGERKGNDSGICLESIQKTVCVGAVFQGWAAPLEPGICLGGMKKMVVWKVSSKGGRHPWNRGFARECWKVSCKGVPHPWNQGFAWEALRPYDCEA